MRTASRPMLRRLLTLDRLIRKGDYPNATALGLELEVHARTVHRDLEFLRDSWGAPLEFCPRRNGYFYREPAWTLPVLSLAEGEVIALFLAERLLQEYAGTPYAGMLAQLFDKITMTLSDTIKVDLGHLDQVYSVSHKQPASDDTTLFHTLANAVRRRRQLQLTYWTATRNEVCTRRVDPYHLVSVEGDWYLIAFCHLREDIRMFVPGRIRKVKETGKTFERPTDFRIGDYLDHSFKAFRGAGKPQQVRLRFTPELARFIREKQWHHSQRLDDQTDGGVIVTLQVNHLLEIKRWAMSYGSDCEVLEPAELREEIRTELKRVGQLYKSLQDCPDPQSNSAAAT